MKLEATHPCLRVSSALVFVFILSLNHAHGLTPDEKKSLTTCNAQAKKFTGKDRRHGLKVCSKLKKPNPGGLLKVVGAIFPSKVRLNHGRKNVTVVYQGTPFWPLMMIIYPKFCPEGCNRNGFQFEVPQMVFYEAAQPLIFPGAAYCYGNVRRNTYMNMAVKLEAVISGLDSNSVSAPTWCMVKK